MSHRRVLVVCIGNSLVADDGAGPAVYDRLERVELPEDVHLLLLGVGGIRLIDDLDGEELLIVVDAVQLGAAPGTVHVMPWDEIPAAAGMPVTSHSIGVREAIGVGRRLFPERMPQRVVLVGVEGRCFNDFRDMSPEVAAAIEGATAVVLREAGVVDPGS